MPRTQAQIEASRRNGARSRGPVTPEGKTRSARNAIKHGLNTRLVVLNNESLEDFQALLEDATAEYQPATSTDHQLVYDLVSSIWRLHRILAMETAGIDHEVDRQRDSSDEPVDEATRAHLAVTALTSDSRVLSWYSRHEGRLRRAIRDARAQLAARRPPASPAPALPSSTAGTPHTQPAATSQSEPCPHEPAPSKPSDPAAGPDPAPAAAQGPQSTKVQERTQAPPSRRSAAALKSPAIIAVMSRIAALLCACGFLAGAAEVSVVRNRAPLPATPFQMLPLMAVKPQGWLRRQLEIQASGQTGHLDEFWKSLLQSESGWLGGPGESWERGPYYLDGLVPLAFQLDNPKLIAKAKKWVEWTLSNQRPDGAIGPAKNKDWWPNMVMLKVLAQYQEATGDERVVPLMHKYLLHHLAEAPKRPLHEWAIYRAQDEALVIAWVYNRTGDARLLELAKLLRSQAYDWNKHYADFVWSRKLSKPETSLKTHVVNNAMAMKAPAVWYLFSKDPADRDAIHRLLDVMDRHHLLPGGVHSGDEHYAGLSPVQGTELCAVVEGMYSLENVLSIVGDPKLADRLEKMTFNALPATFDKTMWAHQYDQQPNQVLCTVHPRSWTTNGPESNLFGLEPNFGCCTANFHQGWPKYVANMWMATDDGGLAAIAYGPSEVSAIVRDARVRIAEQTEYPFRDSIRLAVSTDKAAEFPLVVRVPSWAAGAVIRVNGKAESNVKPGAFHRILRTWKTGDKVELRFPMDLRVTRWFNNSAAVERGPLVFSLRIGEDWRKLRDHSPAADWEVHPTTLWNYALLADPKSMKVSEKALGPYPFSPDGAPVEITARARKLPGWILENGSAAAPPQSPVISTEPLETITLVPYGAAKLRITAFPVVEK